MASPWGVVPKTPNLGAGTWISSFNIFSDISGTQQGMTTLDRYKSAFRQGAHHAIRKT
jgi:hypothetical protein